MKYITFTVPCYNSEAYMNKCIDSLLTGGENVEIIIVDDGSTDNTGWIAEEYAEQYPSIVKVIHQANAGHGAGVNAGLAAARGKYFKVVDSDDWLDIEALRKVLKQIAFWESNSINVDMIVCDYIYDHALENKQKRIN